MSARRSEALATLGRLGIDGEALAAGATPDPAVATRLAGADAPALAAALAEVGADATATFLAALAPALTDRGAQKAVRRALFRLGQRGVHVPEVASRADDAPRPLAADDDVEGFVSGVDGRGDRIVWLVKAQASGGILVVAAELNEPDGLHDVRLFETTRKQLRETRARLERETGVRLVAAAWRALDALLLEGQERSGSIERARDYRRLRTRVTTRPPAPAAELSSPRVRPPDDDETSTLAHAAVALLGEPELSSWWPSPEQAKAYLDELSQVRESPLVLAPQQQEERVRAVMSRAVQALYPPASTARRLEATAYVFAESGRLPAARQALATARLLRERGALGAEVPLLAALVQQRLGALYAATQAERAESRRGSLVVTPGDALTARSPGRPGRTPG